MNDADFHENIGNMYGGSSGRSSSNSPRAPQIMELPWDPPLFFKRKKKEEKEGRRKERRKGENELS